MKIWTEYKSNEENHRIEAAPRAKAAAAPNFLAFAKMKSGLLTLSY